MAKYISNPNLKFTYEQNKEKIENFQTDRLIADIPFGHSSLEPKIIYNLYLQIKVVNIKGLFKWSKNECESGIAATSS